MRQGEQNHMPEVVALGDANVDIIAHFAAFPAKGDDALAISTEVHCGGSATNTALALARMGVRTSLIARVGPDSWALKVFGSLSEAGVMPTGLQRDPTAMTGLMYVVVTPDGERTMLGHRGANVFTDPNQIDENEIQNARLFHLSGYALLTDPQRSAALRALEAACRYSLIITLDPGMAVPQKALDEMRAVLPTINILLPSLSEAQQLTGKSEPRACAQALLQAGVGGVALKLGRNGCLMATQEDVFHVPGFAIQTLDSTGAGDNFDAGLIAGHLGGLDWRGAALLANAMGAMSATRVGASAAGAKPQDILDLLSRKQQEVGPAIIRQVSDLVRTLATESQKEGKPWWK